MALNLSGVMTAIVTPMRDGDIDVPALRALVRQQIDGGVRALIACGSTGEAATLNAEEQQWVIEVVAEEARGQVPVIAGVGARSTHEARAEALRAAVAGADGLLVVTPAYNKPTQGGLVAHFESVAEATDLPIVLYNVPGRTGVDLQAATVAQLARHERIVAIKEATGDLVRAAEIRRTVPADFALLSGDDFTYLPFIAVGGDGCISVLSNVLPSRLVAMDFAARGGDRAKALELHLSMLPLMRALFCESNPIPAKTALAWMGVIPSAELRLPLTPMTDAGAEVLAAAMRGAGMKFKRAPGAPSSLGPGAVG